MILRRGLRAMRAHAVRFGDEVAHGRLDHAKSVTILYDKSTEYIVATKPLDRACLTTRKSVLNVLGDAARATYPITCHDA